MIKAIIDTKYEMITEYAEPTIPILGSKIKLKKMFVITFNKAIKTEKRVKPSIIRTALFNIEMYTKILDHICIFSTSIESKYASPYTLKISVFEKKLIKKTLISEIKIKSIYMLNNVLT